MISLHQSGELEKVLASVIEQDAQSQGAHDSKASPKSQTSKK
jgi:hypothetical protein